MYTNIDTEHAITAITVWLDSLDLPNDYPLGAVKEAMVLVMKNNIFEWGDIYFLQLLELQWGHQLRVRGQPSTTLCMKWVY
ncbi:hypothetical protein ACHAWF_016502 [Thalassiosira exigua]